MKTIGEEFYDTYYLENEGNSNLSKNLRFITAVFEIAELNKHSKLTVLDLGCGKGFYSKIFYDLKHTCIGLDFSEIAIHSARVYFPHIEFINARIETFSTQKKFDLIFTKSFSPLNTKSKRDIVEFFDHMNTVLNENGTVILISHTNFSGVKSDGWIMHSEDEILDFYQHPSFNSHVFFLPKRFARLITLNPLPVRSYVRMVSYFTKNVLIKFGGFDLPYIVVMKKNITQSNLATCA